MPLPIPSTSNTALQQQLQQYYQQIQVFYNLTASIYAIGDNILYNNPLGYASSTVASTLGANGVGILQWQAVFAGILSTANGATPPTNAGNFTVSSLSTGQITVTPVQNPGPLSTIGGGFGPG